MAIQPTDRRDRAAKDIIEPAVQEGFLPARIETEVKRRLEREEYVEALVIAIYFD